MTEMFRILVWYAILVVAIHILTTDSTEAQMKLWRSVARGCQIVARTVGQIGIYAENRYHLSRGAL